MLLHYSLRQQAVVGQESCEVKILLEVPVLSLDSVACQQDRGLGRTVDLVRENGILHLQNKCDVGDLLIF